jgi:N-acetylmuramoyl-L-alanine amidase
MAIKIALDAGHGLKTAGKQTPNGIKEWTLNDKVRDKVISYLSAYDVEILNVDGNEGNTDESLSARLNAYLKAGAKAFVSIHHNAYTGSWNGATGVEVYTDKNPTTADLKLADCIYGRLVKYTGLKGRGIKKENWYVINQNKIPAVLVEGGFMDGTTDYKVITSDAGQDAYARAVAEGLVEFLNIPKKATTPKKESAPTNTFKSYKVKVTASALNIRKGAGTNYGKSGVITDKGVYTIVDEANGKGATKWGKLKSGVGWISLDFCKKI